MTDEIRKRLLAALVERDRQVLKGYDDAKTIDSGELVGNYADFAALAMFAVGVGKIMACRLLWKKMKVTKRLAKEQNFWREKDADG